MPNSQQRLLAILAKLEKCRAALIKSGTLKTAYLVSIAALDVQIKLNGIGENKFHHAITTKLLQKSLKLGE